MKIRCQHNSLRLRVRKSELEQLRQRGQLSESVRFAEHQCFRYTLRHDRLAETVQANFHDGEIDVVIPSRLAEEWMRGNKVGIEDHIMLGPVERLHILIEKDFPCKDRSEEDEADFFGELAGDSVC